MSPLDKITAGRTGGLAGLVDRLSRRVGSGDRVKDGVTRRGLLAGTAVAGSALAVDPKAYALTPQTAYATICGPGNHAWDGWTVFCCTVNNGVNSCPPGSFAAGWWKAARSSWCGGGYQYIVDCNAKCTGCTSGCSGDHICNSSCWNCSCGSGSTATCDQRRHCCNAFRYGQCNTQISCSGGVNCRVLSCVPPYKWANCTTTSLVDNRTAEHGAPCLEGWGPIAVKYNAMGGHGSALRASKGPERSVGDGRGKYVVYEGGYIFWTATTYARAVLTPAKLAWDAAGGTRVLGYPTSDKVVVTGGWYQTFEKGTIVDGPTSGVAVVRGTSQALWTAAGGYGGVLGWPTANHTTFTGGWIQTFQHGVTIDGPSSPACYVAGSVYTYWTSQGGRTGRLGYPLANPVTTASGVYQRFQGGVVVDPAGTVGPFVVDGDFLVCWTHYQLGAGLLGMPLGPVADVAGGRMQRYAGGEMWQRTGAPVYGVRGRVLGQWQAAGGAAGSYGFPLEDTRMVSMGVFEQRFEGGTIRVEPTARRTLV